MTAGAAFITAFCPPYLKGESQEEIAALHSQ